VGSSLLSTRPPERRHRVADGSTAPSAGAGSEPWTDLELGPFAHTAELTANDSDRLGGIATDTAFGDATPASSYTIR